MMQELGRYVYVIGSLVGPQKVGSCRDIQQRARQARYARAKQFGERDPDLRILAYYLLPESIAWCREVVALSTLRPYRVGLGWFAVRPEEAIAAVEDALPPEWRCRDYPAEGVEILPERAPWRRIATTAAVTEPGWLDDVMGGDK